MLGRRWDTCCIRRICICLRTLRVTFRFCCVMCAASYAAVASLLNLIAFCCCTHSSMDAVRLLTLLDCSWDDDIRISCSIFFYLTFLFVIRFASPSNDALRLCLAGRGKGGGQLFFLSLPCVVCAIHEFPKFTIFQIFAGVCLSLWFGPIIIIRALPLWTLIIVLGYALLVLLLKHVTGTTSFGRGRGAGRWPTGKLDKKKWYKLTFKRQRIEQIMIGVK